ncbi:hypothetical protein D0T84_06380 [Dysgonomonas sp. 521]|nr:hypothetical protein [Dysgonomonas sp. 521]
MFTYQTMKLTAVQADGSPATGYQWYIDGVAAPGETNPDFYYSPGTTGLTADALGNMKKTPKIKCDISNACGTVTSNEYEVTVVLATLGKLSPIYVNAWSEAATNANDFTDKTTGLVRTTYAHVNLGAEYELDPCEMLGDLYQWGRPKDGHQSRTPLSGTTNVQSTVAPPGHGNFILAASNWLSSNISTLWGDGSQNYTMLKVVANDPCPDGWKVPSYKQWGAIYQGGTIGGHPIDATANKWTPMGTFEENSVSGHKLSDALYLPAAGLRSDGDGKTRMIGILGLYWTSTATAGGYESSMHYSLSNTYIYGTSTTRVYGIPVRCISD